MELESRKTDHEVAWDEVFWSAVRFLARKKIFQFT